MDKKTFKDYGIRGIDESILTEQRALCPECSHTRQHNPNQKCLAVNVLKEIWYCHHCGWLGGLAHGETQTKVYPSITPSKPVEAENLLTGYFKTRGITKKTIEDNNIYMAEIYSIGHQSYRKAVAFPYYIGEKIVACKYRTKDKKFQGEKGSPSVFYKLNDVIFEDEVIVTEGEMDALSYYEAGIINVISVPGGGPPPTAVNIKMSYLDDAYDLLKGKKKFYLSLDNDPVGKRLTREFARRLGKARCWIITMPDGCKDANDVLVRYGPQYLRRCYENAKPYPIDGIFSLHDVESSLDEIYTHGFPSGVKSGISTEFDELLTFHPGMITVVTGIPNSGKSPFVDQLALSLYQNANWKTGFFSPEDGRIEIHASRLIRQLVNKNMFGPNRMSQDEFEMAKMVIGSNFYFVHPKDEVFTMDNILDSYKYLVAKYGIKLAVLDPWNTIEHQMSPGESETIYIGRQLNKIKYFARDMDIHIVIVAHPTKIPRQHNSRKYEIPTLYSISGSANWFNVPENGIAIYREYSEDMKETLHTAAYVQKVKFDFVGKQGVVKFQYDVPSQRFNI